MRSISVEELERRRLRLALEQRRTRLMRTAFEDAGVMDEAIRREALKRKGRRQKFRRGFRPLAAFGLASALVLISGGALAYATGAAPRLREILAEIAELVSPGQASVGRSRSRIEGRSEAVNEQGKSVRMSAEAATAVPHREAYEHAPAQEGPAARNAAKQAAHTPEAQRAPVARNVQSPAGARPNEAASSSSPSGTSSRAAAPVAGSENSKPDSPSNAQSWKELAAAMNEADLMEAETKALHLSQGAAPEVRDAAELVAAQVQLRRDGSLSAASRRRLERLALHSMTANIRGEAIRILKEHP